jgi:plastocyanin
MKIGVIFIVLLVSISFVSANNVFFSPEMVYQDKFVLQELSLPKLFFSSPFLELKQPVVVKELVLIKEKLEKVDDKPIKPDLIKLDLIELSVKEIIISENVFRFETVIINVGQKVIWKNGQKRLPALINGVREISAMKSGHLQFGDSFSWKFTEAGEYTYVDSVVIGRVGKIVVNP